MSENCDWQNQNNQPYFVLRDLPQGLTGKKKRLFVGQASGMWRVELEWLCTVLTCLKKIAVSCGHNSLLLCNSLHRGRIVRVKVWDHGRGKAVAEHTGELRAACSSGLSFARDQDRLVESCDRAGTSSLSASSHGFHKRGRQAQP